MNKFFTKIIGASLAIAMMIGVGAGVNANKPAKMVDASGSGDWVQITALNGINTSDKYVIASNATAAGVDYYFNGTVDKGHFQSTAFSNNAPASDSADGVFQFEEVDAENNIYKLKLVSTDKYITATKAGSGGGSITAGIDSSGWKFLSSSNNFNAIYQTAYSSKYAALRNYSSTSWRTYSNNSATSVTTSSGDTFRIYKYQAAKVLDTISVALNNPSATWYVGQIVNAADVSVTPNYTDGTSGTPITNGTGVTITNGTLNNVGSNQITVSYGGKSATLNVVAQEARTKTGIELHGTISKSEYYVGENWELAGLDIQVNWSSGEPTYVGFDDESVTYVLTPETATNTSTTSFNIQVTYSGFNETFTVDGLTVTEHPKTDVLTDAIIGVQAASYTSNWTEISDVEDYTGAKYMFRTMKPASGQGYTMNTNGNGYMVTTYCPAGLKLKSISFSFLTNNKSLGIYASNTAYTVGTAPSATSVGTVNGTGSSVSFDFSALEVEYRYVAFKGLGTSTIVGTVTVEYEELIPEITVSPTSIDLATGLSRTVEVTVDKFIDTPSLACNVISGASYIASASVGNVNNQNKAVLTIEASEQSGTAVVRVSASQNLTTYYADVTVNVLESTKSIIENNLNSKASLSFKYTKHSISDTLTVTSIANNGNGYCDWADRAGSTTEAVYAGNTYAGNDSAIQMRTDGSASGIITTTSGGTATRVAVTWGTQAQSGRGIEVYGKNTPYVAASDLYGDNKGTLIGTITCGTNTSLQLAGNYAYIGIKSINAAIYLASLEIEWGATFDYSNVAMRLGGSINQTLWEDLDTASHIEGYGVMISTSNSIKNRYNAVKDAEGGIDEALETVQGQGYKLVKGTDIRTFYNTTSTSPAVQGDNYFWNLYQRINNAPEDINRVYTAVAFIRTTNDGLVFLGEISTSAVQLAGDTLTNDPNENVISEGSLAYFAGLTL